MGWIFGKEVDEKVAALDRALKDSFVRVRQDTDALYQWIAYLQQASAQHQQLIEAQQHDLDDAAELITKHEQEAQRQRQLIERLQADLQAVPKDAETIKRVIDAYYDFDAMMDRIRQLESKTTRLEHSKVVSASVAREVRHELPHVQQPLPSRALPAFKDKIVQQITRNSKEYLKGLIMSAITKYGKISALQLRVMLVEEQGLASKSSFYRLLEELEDEGAVEVISDGKEKVMVPAGIAKHASEGHRR